MNIHAAGFWWFLILVAAAATLAYGWKRVKRTGNMRHPLDFSGLRDELGVKIGVGIILLIVAVFLIGTLLSSPIINASKYQQLMTVEEREFSEDIQQVSFDQIPLLDKDSAALLANRVMGSLVDLTSQFVVSDQYSQINYQGKPVRVTPLAYADLIKWFTNRGDGIPGYIKIDMTTQEAELVRLEQGMKYTPYDHFGRNLQRHLRFRYPTYIFDSYNFEINEEGVPYWVCGVKKFNVGLFGGETIGRVVLCNAVTGECEDYAIEDAPTWIDRAYSADMLIELYDYGVTSITSDQSIVGFVLMNQRTMKTRYYQVEGAIEDSAMSSAEGQVQHLGYVATFPLLLNISDEPTYFIALKDEAGLVKMYAMVNVQRYQLVATGDTVSECENNYVELLRDSGVQNVGSSSGKTVTGRIERMFQAVVDGNSHCYLLLAGSDIIYDVTVADTLPIVRYQEGDSITLEYLEGEQSYTVLGIVE